MRVGLATQVLGNEDGLATQVLGNEGGVGNPDSRK